MRAQKKPVVIDYFPVNELTENFFVDLCNWVSNFNQNPSDHFTRDQDKLQVKTLEGTSYDVTTDDVIIRGVQGEFYPCKKDIFEITYDTL